MKSKKRCYCAAASCGNGMVEILRFSLLLFVHRRNARHLGEEEDPLTQCVRQGGEEPITRHILVSYIQRMEDTGHAESLISQMKPQEVGPCSSVSVLQQHRQNNKPWTIRGVITVHLSHLFLLQPCCRWRQSRGWWWLLKATALIWNVFLDPDTLLLPGTKRLEKTVLN